MKSIIRTEGSDILFWEKVDQKGPSDCWNWKACVNSANYGQIRLKAGIAYAHRYAWECKRGPIPDGLCVLHHCDNSRCCNPNHLFLGTKLDNMHDAMSKGRHPNAELSEDNVREIRKFLKIRKISQRKLAKMYGVAQPTICDISRGRTWQHIAIEEETQCV
jgi:hypothetical protein